MCGAARLFSRRRVSSQEFFSRGSAGYLRKAVLIGCFVLWVVIFPITAFVARLYHKEIHALADGWFAMREVAFPSVDAIRTLSNNRNAFVYASNSRGLSFTWDKRLLPRVATTKRARVYLIFFSSCPAGKRSI